MDCIFCKIAAGEIPSKKIFEDDEILVFYDIDPKAPIHFLVIPKEHIGGADEIDESSAALVGHIFQKIAEITYEMGITNGYRIISNVGKDGGQSVRHLHFHVLAGRELAWPPG